MIKTHILSKLISKLSLIISVCTFLILFYALGSKLLGVNLGNSQGQDLVYFPFTQTSFLKIEMNWSDWLVSFSLPLFFYGIFFFLLGRVLNIFNGKIVFTIQNKKKLEDFLWYNSLIPFLILGIVWIFGSLQNGAILIALLHFILAFFVFIVTTFFKKGLDLQLEQDLYI